MSNLRHCPTCKKIVVATRPKFHWIAMLILSFATGIGGIIYILIWLFMKRKCTICGGKCNG